MRKIFDIHMHFPRNWEKPDSDPKPLVENLYKQAKAAGVTKANFLCGGRWGISFVGRSAALLLSTQRQSQKRTQGQCYTPLAHLVSP